MRGATVDPLVEGKRDRKRDAASGLDSSAGVTLGGRSRGIISSSVAWCSSLGFVTLCNAAVIAGELSQIFRPRGSRPAPLGRPTRLGNRDAHGNRKVEIIGPTRSHALFEVWAQVCRINVLQEEAERIPDDASDDVELPTAVILLLAQKPVGEMCDLVTCAVTKRV